MDKKNINNFEKIFESIFKDVPEAVAIYKCVNRGRDFIVQYFNRSAEKIEKVKASKIVGKKIMEVFPSVKKFGIFKVLLRVCKTGKPERFPTSFYVDKRIAGWRDNHIFKLPSGDVAAIYTDETENKKKQEQLSENENKYRTLFGSSSDAIFLMKGNIFIDCNKKTLKMFNCRRDQIIGKPPYNVFSPKKQLDGRMSIVSAKEKIKLALGGKPQIFEWRHRRFDGGEFDAQVNLNKVEYGRQKYLLASVRDISYHKTTDLKLEESEERYHKLFEHAIDAIFIADPVTKKIINCNSTAEKFIGYSRAKILSMKAQDLHPKDLVKETMRGFQKQATGKIEQIFTEVLTKNKKRVAVAIKGSTIHIRGRSYLQGIFRDISEQKRIEEELRKSERRYKMIVDNVNDAFYLHDFDGKILDVNENARKMTGRTRNELIGANASIVDTPEQAKSIFDRIKKVKKAGRLLFESQHRKKDGTHFWVSVSAKLVSREGNGLIESFVRDISDQKESEERLKESEAKYKVLISNLPKTEYVLVHQNGKILWANNNVFSFLGYSGEKIIGTSIFDYVDKEYLSIVLEATKKRMLGEKVNDYEIKIKNKKGYLADVLIRGSLISYENQRAILLVLSDITKFKELDRVKSEFVSVASHQLKTPLSGIKWALESILRNREGNLTEKQIVWLRDVYENNERMIILINDLLGVSKIDTAAFHLNISRVEMITLIERIVSDLSSFANDRKVKICIKNYLPPNYSMAIDQEKIHHAILNLITNSIKYSKFEGGVVEINTRIKNGKFTFSIKDNGVGIPENNQRHIFEKFYRADNASISQATGTGLGLYIAKNFIEQHGGNIWFRSREGIGTTFYFSIGDK